MHKLDATTARQLIASLDGWTHDPARDAIVRELRFADFAAAFACMTRLALYAERHDHHPEWFNVYNRLTITLTTHDAGGLTQRDIDFARHVDAVAASLGAA